MKQILRGAGAFALALTLAACGGAPASPGAGTSATSGAGTAGDTSATSSAGTTGTSAAGDTSATSSAGTTGTSAAGDTSATSSAGTTGTSAAGTTGTSAAGDTSATSSAGTTGTSTAGDTSATSSAGTTGTSTAGTADAVLGDLTADPRFSTLAGLLTTTGLSSQLEALGPFTLFAPTNDAFAALPAGTLDTLAQNPSLLQEILLYHVATGAIRSSDIASATAAPTAAGEDLNITSENGTVTVNGTATVVEADITAGEGVIHAIDQVLVPPGVALGS
jgi:transforming growth factor-beta-induced protein